MRGRTVARGLLAGLLLTALWSWPGVAQACSCRGPNVALVRPAWPSSSGLRLISESLELDCAEPNLCRWRSIHVYARDQPGAPARVPMQLPFVDSTGLTVRWGSVPVELATEDQRQAAIDQAELDRSDGGLWLWLEDDGQPLTVELEIEGEVIGEGIYWPSCCHLTALEIRHRFVPRPARANTWRWGEHDSPAVAPDARTHVRIDADPDMRVEVGRAKRNTARRGPLSLEIPADRASEFAVLERQRITGGPFIAAGGAILDANPARGRIGWEHTFTPPFLFYSAALETDFTSELTFVPAVEITHGGSLVTAIVFPRAGFGVGVPVQFLPDPRPGLRAQVSFSWIVFSILTTFDWLPELPLTRAGEERPHMLKLAFLGQFSF